MVAVILMQNSDVTKLTILSENKSDTPCTLYFSRQAGQSVLCQIKTAIRTQACLNLLNYRKDIYGGTLRQMV